LKIKEQKMNNRPAKLLLTGTLPLFLFLSGCYIHIDGCSYGHKQKFERTIQVSAPLKPGSAFQTKTHNGAITINGTDTTDCNITAKIIAKAPTLEEAQELAEIINIKFVTSGDTLIAKIEKPALLKNKSVTVNFDVTLPNQTDLNLTTHNGGVNINNITCQVFATTHNGGLTATKLAGPAKLQTHNGRISCTQISGDINLKTHNGGIKAVYAKDAPPTRDISLVTHNGSIKLTTPPNYSAAVEASTHNGSIYRPANNSNRKSNEKKIDWNYRHRTSQTPPRNAQRLNRYKINQRKENNNG